MVTVKINGREITVEDGTLILDAAKSSGFDIPTMCYHARLSKLASCRVCLVEIVGQKKLQPSCVTPVIHAMEVLTESPVVKSARASMIELLLANHPLDCPVCDKGGECELQDVTFKFGPRKSLFAEQKRRLNEEDFVLSPVIIKNANRCIQCKRCVRICDEVVGASVLGSIERGVDTEETSFVKEYLDCDHCGNCIEVCPVGSLMSRPYRYKSRPWDMEEVDTVCTYCGTGCQMTVQSINGEVARVISKPDKGINNETLCVRGRFGYSFINNRERVLTPLIRKNGRLIPATWNEAIRAIKEGLIKAAQDRKKVGGIASSRLSNEELYLFQRFMRVVLKTNNIDSSSRWNSDTVKTFTDIMGLRNGGVSIYDALKVDTLFIIGSSISDENPVTDYIIRRLSRNKKLNTIVASSRGIRLDGLAALCLRHRPGTEGELIGAISKAVYDNNKDKLKTLKNVAYIENLSEDIVSSLTCIDWGAIKSVSELMTASRSITIAVGTDVLRLPAQLEYLDILVNVLRTIGKDVRLFPVLDRANQRGAWDMGVHPGISPGYHLTDEEGLGCEGMIDAAYRGEMGVLYVIGEDLVSYFPDGGFVKDAVGRVDFLIVQDMFLSETARMANVVLPGVSFLEKDGTFTNQEGRVQRLRKLFRPQGDAKADWEIIATIGEYMAPSFFYSSVSDIFEEIKRFVPMYRGIDFDSLNGDGALVKVAPGGVSSRAQAGSLHLAGWQARRDTSPGATSLDPEYPFILITGNYLYHSGRITLKMDILREILPEAFAEISEEDAKEMGISEGARIKVKGKRYEATLPARINKGSARGVVFIPENFTDVPANMFFIKGEGFPRVNVVPVVG